MPTEDNAWARFLTQCDTMTPQEVITSTLERHGLKPGDSGAFAMSERLRKAMKQPYSRKDRFVIFGVVTDEQYARWVEGMIARLDEQDHLEIAVT